ncbi:MAG: hypothetical protein PWP08_1619 [Methanofollis sp.]|nr:hypothetical protein [Methanofollis sp.]
MIGGFHLLDAPAERVEATRRYFAGLRLSFAGRS